MPERMRDIKRRIRSVQNIEQITKAMEMVAAVSLRKAQSGAEAARPYSREIRSMMQRLVSLEKLGHPLLLPTRGEKPCFMVFTSDRGMCGAYNAKVTRLAQDAMKAKGTKNLVVVGRKGRDFFRRRGYNILAESVGLGDEPGVARVRPVIRKVLDLYQEGSIDEVNLVYTEFVTTSKQQPVVQRLLPIETVADEQGKGDPMGTYIYEPDEETVLSFILPRFVEAQVYRAVLEAKASEQAARMMAMGSATENAGEMIGQLTLTFNKARQAAITKELSEIVGGAEALKG